MNDIFENRRPTICQRAYCLWELMRDFRADCEALDPDELSRRCEDICDALRITEEKIAGRPGLEEDE